jgi:hypothetical protein
MRALLGSGKQGLYLLATRTGAAVSNRAPKEIPKLAIGTRKAGEGRHRKEINLI